MTDQRIVRAKVNEVLNLARSIYGTLPPPNIEFSNRMTRCAGMYKYNPSGFGSHTLVFSNPIIRDNDVEVFCNDTVIHEVAHFVDRFTNGSSAHNQRFYNIMRRLGNTNPTRTHSFKTVKRNGFKYTCDNCGEPIELGAIRHNKFQLYKTRYTHSKCGRRGTLTFVG